MSERTVICFRGATWRLYPCKLWTGAIREGYGIIRRERKLLRITRVVLAQSLGRQIAPGKLALHHCDTPLCYEIEHLYEGSRADNMWDMSERGRHPFQRRPGLTTIERDEIRRRHAAGGIGYARLAAEYGVGETTIRHVVKRTRSR